MPRNVQIVAMAEGRKVAPVGVELREGFAGGLRILRNGQTALVPCGASVLSKTFPDHLTNLVEMPLHPREDNLVPSNPDSPEGKAPEQYPESSYSLRKFGRSGRKQGLLPVNVLPHVRLLSEEAKKSAGMLPHELRHRAEPEAM
jgi:hypothetical protein